MLNLLFLTMTDFIFDLIEGGTHSYVEAPRCLHEGKYRLMGSSFTRCFTVRIRMLYD